MRKLWKFFMLLGNAGLVLMAIRFGTDTASRFTEICAAVALAATAVHNAIDLVLPQDRGE